MTEQSYNIADIREKKLPLVHQAASDTAHLSSRLVELATRLGDFSRTLLELFEQEADLNSEESRKVWHDLNGLQHLIEQFSHHTEVALDDFKRDSLALIDALQEKRPPREE